MHVERGTRAEVVGSVWVGTVLCTTEELDFYTVTVGSH